MASDDNITYDRSLLGKEESIGTFHITREMILAFARATGDPHPLYSDEAETQASEHGDLIAPPTFCNIFIEGFRRPDIKLQFGDVGLFANQAIEPLALVRAGDTLEARTKLEDVYTKTGRSGDMVFVVWETRFINQHGETAVVVRDSFMRRNRPKP
jgi:acyl dehydratase